MKKHNWFSNMATLVDGRRFSLTQSTKVIEMPHDEDDGGKSYDKARVITEKALDAYVADDDEQGDELIKQAKSVNKDAVEDVSEELEEDAESEHDPEKLNQQIANDKKHK